MALRKLLPLPSGVSPDYIRISSLVFNRNEGFVQINLSAFLDADHAANGADPVAEIAPVIVQGEEAAVLIAALHDLAGPLAYATVRDTPQFADAVDV